MAGGCPAKQVKWPAGNSARNHAQASMTNKSDRCTPRLYGIKNCDTMKKAIAWLEAKGIAFEFVDYKKAGIASDKLATWVARASTSDRMPWLRCRVPRMPVEVKVSWRCGW